MPPSLTPASWVTWTTSGMRCGDIDCSDTVRRQADFTRRRMRLHDLHHTTGRSRQQLANPARLLLAPGLLSIRVLWIDRMR